MRRGSRDSRVVDHTPGIQWSKGLIRGIYSRVLHRPVETTAFIGFRPKAFKALDQLSQRCRIYGITVMLVTG
jgi:hypothetical protein